VLEILFVTDQAWLHFSGYINSQKSTIWSAVNPHAMYESPLHSSELVFGVQCLDYELWDHCSLKILGVGVGGGFSGSAVVVNTLFMTVLVSLQK